MAQLPSVFNTSDHEEMGEFTPVPEFIYEAEIAKSELKTTRDKTGQYLSLQFKILDEDSDDHKVNGRYIFKNLNLVNKNQQAVDIAKRELKSICVACGIDGELDDSVDLHNIPMYIRVAVKEATAEWPAGNDIKKYYAIDSDNVPEDQLFSEAS